MNTLTIKYTLLRCEAGHEIKMNDGAHPMSITKGKTSKHFDFCMECWAIWATAKWPMKEVQ